MGNGAIEYRAVEAWLNSLSVEEIAVIERERTVDHSIDKELVIETILEHCKYEDDLLFKLHKQATALSRSIKFHATGPQAFTDVELPDKYLSVEVIICYMDHTWNTDYVYIPYPEQDASSQELTDLVIGQWEKEEVAAAEQRGSIGPMVAHVGLYNVNWDEPVDKDGNGWEEPVDIPE